MIREYGDYPTLSEIVRDYQEIVEFAQYANTLEELHRIQEKHPDLTIGINDGDMFLDEFEYCGGTNADIECVRYEVYGCLQYIYFWFEDGKPTGTITFDVWSELWHNVFVEDVSIENIQENYEQYIKLAEKAWADYTECHTKEFL